MAVAAANKHSSVRPRSHVLLGRRCSSIMFLSVFHTSLKCACCCLQGDRSETECGGSRCCKETHHSVDRPKGDLQLSAVCSAHCIFIPCFDCRVTSLKQRVVAVAPANKHTAVLTDQGAIYSWGANDQGQLGYGTSDSASNAVPRQVEAMKVHRLLPATPIEPFCEHANTS